MFCHSKLINETYTLLTHLWYEKLKQSLYSYIKFQVIYEENTVKAKIDLFYLKECLPLQ